MAVTALQVKELRSRTGAGILDAKKALEEADGDIEKAIVILQEKGAAKAVKKAGRIAAEGLISTTVEGNKASIVEVNSETDFVAMNKTFQELVAKISKTLVSATFNTDEEAANVPLDGKTVGQVASDATTTIGEKIHFRRAKQIVKTDSQTLGAYTHVNGKVGALVLLEGGNEEIAKNVAMHITAMNPQYLDVTEVPNEQVEGFKAEIMKEINEDPKMQNKPEKIKLMMSEGKLNKVLSEITLVNQAFVMESKQSVEKYLASHGAVAKAMVRFEVGEGIEKNEVDFAAEVASQMK
ncbi:MAG: translation elongation factor Ts [Mycoplasma sp.]|nr:translation elongation factor Ts [Mycoplasma sp.]